MIIVFRKDLLKGRSDVFASALPGFFINAPITVSQNFKPEPSTQFVFCYPVFLGNCCQFIIGC